MLTGAESGGGVAVAGDPDASPGTAADVWRRRLADLVRLELAPDHPRSPAAVAEFRTVAWRFPEESAERLRAAAARWDVSAPAVLHAALCGVLVRHTGQDDLAVGLPLGDGLAVLRLAVTDPEFRELAESCEQGLAEARRLGPVPASVLADQDSLVPVHVAYEGFQDRAAEISLRVHLGRTVEITLDYAAHVYEPERVTALLRHWQRVLDQGLRSPQSRISALPALDDAERAALVDLGTGPAGPALATTLHARAVASMRTRPDSMAMVCDGASLTHAELDTRSQALAFKLRRLGVGPGSVVASVLDRGPHTLVAILGVHRAGAAYSPIDPAFPTERIAFVLRDTAAPVVLADTASADVARAALDAAPGGRLLLVDEDHQGPVHVEPFDDPDALAYVLFTSGSTGTPKGVRLTHRAMATYVDWMVRTCDVGPASRVLHACPPVFDLCVGEIYSALWSGGCSVVAGRDDVLGAGRLTELVARERVTHTFTAPTLLALLTPDGGALPDWVLACGEVLPPELAARWTAAGSRVLDLYGPAEAAVACTFHDCSAGASGPGAPGRPLPIGRPMPGRLARVLDRFGDLAPHGAVGELLVGGAGIAQGYLNRPELTTQRFVPDPFTGDPAYRTGDLARWNPDGELEFLGRADTQVKLNGVRIELGEIESVLIRHPDVALAAAAVRTEPGPACLVAHVTANAGRRPVPALLREHAARFLPASMVPAVVVVADRLPLGATGKVDRRALAALGGRRPELPGAYRSPESVLEQAVVRAMQAVLSVAPVGADDGFFELGGSSLDASRLCAALGTDPAVAAEVGHDPMHGPVPIPVSQLYRTSSAAALGEWLAASAPGGAVAAASARAIAPASARSITAAGSARAIAPAAAPTSAPPASSATLHPGQANLVTATPLLVCPLIWWTEGDLDLPALRAAIRDVHHRHQALHAVYQPADPPAALVPPTPGDPEFALLDAEPDDATALAAAREAVQAPLDPTAGQVWRTVVVPSRGSGRILLALGIHHIAFDAPSQEVLVRDLGHAYAARIVDTDPLWDRRAPTLTELAERAALAANTIDLQPQREYWLRQLRSLQRLALPGARPGLPSPWGPKEGRLFDLPPAIVEPWDEAARSAGTSRLGWLAGVFARVLAELTGHRDVAMLVPSAARGDAVADAAMGCRLDAFCLRVTPGADPTANGWLTAAAKATSEALRAQDLPFAQVLGALATVRPDLHVFFALPTFQVQDRGAATPSLPGVRLTETRDRLAREVPTALTVEVLAGVTRGSGPDAVAAPDGAGLCVRVTVRTDLFPIELAERIGGRFAQFVQEGPAAR